ncbi:MAG: 4a-hydroxytetrahydrobiopterin dehydratase [Bacteroidota bacterium]
MPALIPDAEIATKLRSLKGWVREGKEIRKTVTQKDFVHAMGFVTSVALLAEKINHHPDIDIRWNTVTLVLSTHSAGGLTENDFTLASMIDEI